MTELISRQAAIEAWCKFGVESDLPEVRNFKFLQMKYGFRVLDNEVPVILFNDDEPIAAGVDVCQHPRSSMDENAEFLTKRPLKVKLICEL